jgi:hypothetical protein
MSEAAARSVTEVEPVVVTGNEGERDSGSLRAPHSQERNMTAVERVPDEIGLMVVQWQTTPSELVRRNLGNAILLRLKPIFRAVAGRFPDSARGSLRYEDLEQIAAIEAFKFFSKYNAEKAGSAGASFEQHVYRRALNACQQHVELHASDVRPSLHLQRASRGQGTDAYKGRKVDARAFVKSRDAQAATGHRPEAFDGARELDNGGSAYSLSRPGAVDSGQTPEALLGDAQRVVALVSAINRLSPEKGSLVREHFGICVDRDASLRDMARRRKVPRSRLAIELDEALKELREEMECL